MADDDRLGFLEQRRARKIAKQRQEHWDKLRGMNHPSPAAGAPARQLPPLAQRPLEPVDGATSRRLLAAAAPILAAVLAIASASSGLPMFTQDVRPAALLVGAVATAAATYWAVTESRRPGARRSSLVGVATAGVLVVAFAAGAATQAVVDGKAQIVGSEGERVYRQGQEILAAANVLSTTQRLLRLPPEQARALGPMFDAAIAQDAEIAARWNPATAGTVTPPGLAAAYARVNLAAARQSEALAARKQALLSPDTQLDAIAASAYQDVQELLSGEPSGIAAAVQQAYLETGLIVKATQ